MLKKCNEDDFKQLKWASSFRLRPDGISVGIIGALIYNGIMFIGSIAAVVASESYNINLMWYLFVLIELIIFLIEFGVTIFYVNTKRTFKFQKIQSIVLCFVYFHLSISLYQIYFIAGEERKIPSYMIIAGVMLFLGGILLLVCSTIRAILRVRNGQLKEDGKYLYDFSNSKVYYSFPIIFGLVVLGGIISRTLSGMEGTAANLGSVTFILILSVIIQYSVSLAWPEFFLLAYCKSRFSSFTEEMPKFIESKRNQKKKTKSKKRTR